MEGQKGMMPRLRRSAYTIAAAITDGRQFRKAMSGSDCVTCMPGPEHQSKSTQVIKLTLYADPRQLRIRCQLTFHSFPAQQALPEHHYTRAFCSRKLPNHGNNNPVASAAQ